MSLGLTSAQSFELLTHPTVSAAQSQSSVLDGLFDASDRPEGGDVIVWWNDFENDERSVAQVTCVLFTEVVYLLLGMRDGEHQFIS